MIPPDSPTSRQLPPRATIRSLRLQPALAAVAFGAVALSLAACGGSPSTSSTTATSTPASHASSTASVPGVSGSIAAITGQSLEVQSPSAGQTTVNYSSTTTFTQTAPASLSDVTVGTCITAVAPARASSGTTAKPGGTAPLDAITVAITQPSGGSCHVGSGGRLAQTSRAGGVGGTSGTTPGGKTRSARNAQRGLGRVASGSVSAVSGTSFTVQRPDVATDATVTRTVVVSATTTYTQVVGASPGNLAVSLCVRAAGPTSSTGAMTATAIHISQPGPHGCSGGFRRRSRGSGGAAGSGVNAGG